MDDIRKDRRGMSLVEMMIVMAIMGLLSASAVSLMGRVYYANTKKTVETISNALDRLRINTMSKEGAEYLYIYQIDQECYLIESGEKRDSFDGAFMTEKGTKLCGGGTDIFLDSETGTKVEGDAVIRVAYKKSGAFNTDPVEGTNVSAIVVKGSGVTSISLAGETGKHYIE